LTESEILLGLPDLQITGIERKEGSVRISARYTGQRFCAWCRGTALRSKGWIERYSGQAPTGAQEDHRPEVFMFPSRRGTPLNPNNFLRRVLKKAAARTVSEMRKNGVELPDGFLAGMNHQALRRTCATHMQHLGSVKDIQAHLRHARPNITAEVYMQEIPASVRAAVELLDRELTQAKAGSGPVN
jgi:integrase